jgi:hypothetical protein
MPTNLCVHDDAQFVVDLKHEGLNNFEILSFSFKSNVGYEVFLRSVVNRENDPLEIMTSPSELLPFIATHSIYICVSIQATIK